MKRLPHVGSSWPPLIVRGAQAGTRDSGTLQGFLRSPDYLEPMPCLRCPDAPCRRAQAQDFGDLCPVDVLSRTDTPQGLMIGHGCIECGICIAKCPVGAISLGEVGAAVVAPANEIAAPEAVSKQQFLAWRSTVEVPVAMTMTQRRALVDQWTATAAVHRQGRYYRLVESLFNALGIDAKQSNHGDTSNRIDLVLPDDLAPIPVEIKSRSEVVAINWKSVQQALENKLIMARLRGQSALDGTSSLVVGHDYPSARSGISALIDQIDLAFGVRIGLVSLRRLYDLLVGQAMGEEPLARNVIANLKGEL
jgi:ferredoxin